MVRETYDPAVNRRRDWMLLVLWVLVSIVGSLGLLPLWQKINDSLFRSTHDLLIPALVIALSMGVVIGLGQWQVLRRRARVDIQGWWIVGCAVNAVAFLLIALLGSEVSLDARTIMPLSVWTGSIGALAGVVQWRTLRGKVQWARSWILVSTGAGAVGWPVGVLVGIAVFGPAWGASAGWIGVGALSGVALVCKFSQ